ncbi:MAG TPA: hypothetical protein VN257_05115, partial [Actinotalea sp.]|nr:hypothetical protein [Actinotalea sp.]
MRFTLEGVGDLEVPHGVTVASCREALAQLAGPDVAGAALFVGERPLGENQVAGAEPWVAGSLVRRRAGPQDAA